MDANDQTIIACVDNVTVTITYGEFSVLHASAEHVASYGECYSSTTPAEGTSVLEPTATPEPAVALVPTTPVLLPDTAMAAPGPDLTGPFVILALLAAHLAARIARIRGVGSRV